MILNATPYSLGLPECVVLYHSYRNRDDLMDDAIDEALRLRSPLVLDDELDKLDLDTTEVDPRRVESEADRLIERLLYVRRKAPGLVCGYYNQGVSTWRYLGALRQRGGDRFGKWRRMTGRLRWQFVDGRPHAMGLISYMDRAFPGAYVPREWEHPRFWPGYADFLCSLARECGRLDKTALPFVSPWFGGTGDPLPDELWRLCLRTCREEFGGGVVWAMGGSQMRPLDPAWRWVEILREQQ